MSKRFHVHVTVRDVQESLRFYSALFGCAPSVEKPDYAKWMLEEPRLNFAISTHGEKPGVNHLGFQLDEETELQSSRDTLQAAGLSVVEQAQAQCCYAQSSKHWTLDPQGLPWETFHSMGTLAVYGDDSQPAADACCMPVLVAEQANACCTPTANSKCCN